MLRGHKISAYWWRSVPNFGDAIAPLLLERFAGIKPVWASSHLADVVSVGSVLEHIPPDWDGHIIGSGKLFPDSRLNLYTEAATIWALRGPLSAREVPYRDFAIGDPGLLADELVPSQDKNYGLGIVPHWSDEDLEHNPMFTRGNHVVINPTDDPLKVIALIGQCYKIVTSSLHGMIVADAFGIPRRFEYAKQFDREGGRFKFKDYSQSIGAPLEEGKLFDAHRFRVEDRKHEIYDAYAALGAELRKR
jgi:pyruvyltransferase